MDAKGRERGILKLDPRPRVFIDTSRAELTPQGSCEHPPCSPQPSVDRLSVTWAEPGSMSSSGVNLFHLPSETPVSNEVKFSPTAGDGSEDEDYSASLSAVLRQRRASVRRSRKSRARRPSSPFLGDEGPRRRSSAFTTSSGETAISMEEGQSLAVNQEQIFENIHLHKEVLGSVKQQPLGMRRKLKIVHQAKGYIKRHEGQLQERLAQSKSTRDIYARFNILMATKWQQLKREAANTSNLLIPWELRIKEIESHFGSVVASYFTFLRWLFWVNLVIGFVLLVFVIVPEYLTANPDQDGERKKIMDDEVANATNLLTLWEFEGGLKYSAIFYGFYSNIERAQYRMPLAYFLTGLAVYIYSFVAILRKMAENSRMSKLSEKDDECIFSWKLFTGWDFMIGNTETAHNRIASVILGFKEALLEEAEKKKDLRNWRIISLRGLVNVCVINLLTVSAYAVVKVVSRSDDTNKSRGWWRENETTIVVTVISITFPVFFELLGFLEHYHPRKQLRLQLARIMLLNLLNLYSLIFALFNKIDRMSHELDRLKPQLLLNATVSNATLNMTETIVMTIPGSCIEKEIPCSGGSILLTTPMIQDDMSTTPYSLPYSESTQKDTILSRRSREDRNLESLTTEETTTLDTISLISKEFERLKHIMEQYKPLDNTDETEEADYEYSQGESSENEITTKFTTTDSEFDHTSSTNYFTVPTYDPTNDLTSSGLGSVENTAASTEPYEDTTLHDDTNANTIDTDSTTASEIMSTYTVSDSINTNTTAIDSMDTYTTVSDVPSTDITESDSTNTDTTSSDSMNTYTTVSDTSNAYTISDIPNTTLVNSTLSDATIKTTSATIDLTGTTSELTTNKIEESSSYSTDLETYASEETYATDVILTDATAKSTTQLSDNTLEPLTSIAPIKLCPNITFNCTTERGNQNITQVFYVSDCKLVKTVCYVTTCSVKVTHIIITNESTDIGYLDAYNRTMYNLTKPTKKKLLNLCWETMFGQELVKLTMMDLVFVLLGTLFMDFFRALFVRYMNRCWCWDLEKKFPEYGDFKIAENILHLINNQGMVWMGMFFSPGLVVLNVFKLMIMMYLRSWAVMTCNVPHEVVFRVSKSNNFYLALLLTMLFLCVLPVGYTIVWVKPSWHCGPFSEYTKIYYILTTNIYKILPTSLSFVLKYIASPTIVIPLLVLLILIIYYLTSLTNSLREANNDLKIQLRRERTEERRKMFQLADTRRRAGSSGMDNTPFARWKKALPSLPMSKSIDSDDHKTLINEEIKPLKTSKKRVGIFAKIVGLALDKKSDVEAVSEIEIASPSPNNIDDETDTDFHETLPREVLKIKDITIVRPEPKKRNSVEFKTDEVKKHSDDMHFKLKLAKLDDRTEKDAVRGKQRKDLKDKPKITAEIPKEVKKDDKRINEKQTSQSSTQSKQSDSIGSVIPVITISTTESDEEVLAKKHKKIKDKTEVKVRRTPDLKSLRRQSSVESINEPKPPKEQKQEEGHKYQYSL